MLQAPTRLIGERIIRNKGGTFTQHGLQQVDTIPDEQSDDDNKGIVILTDGVPAYSFKTMVE